MAFPRAERLIANSKAILLAPPIVGDLVGFWSMPVTHRLVFSVVFGWVVPTSIRLMRGTHAATTMSREP